MIDAALVRKGRATRRTRGFPFEINRLSIGTRRGSVSADSRRTLGGQTRTGRVSARTSAARAGHRLTRRWEPPLGARHARAMAHRWNAPDTGGLSHCMEHRHVQPLLLWTVRPIRAAHAAHAGHAGQCPSCSPMDAGSTGTSLGRRTRRPLGTSVPTRAWAFDPAPARMASPRALPVWSRRWKPSPRR